MNLKRQLLLVSLLALMLPWAGCEFIRETESALRASQQQMLTPTARAIADSMAQYAEEFPPPLATGTVFGDQLFGHMLAIRPQIDGYFDDWSIDERSLRSMRGTDGPIRFALGIHERALYLYAEITDRTVVFASSRPPSPGGAYADAITLVSSSPPYLRERFEFAAEAPGQILARTSTADPPAPEPSIIAYWQDVPGGYHLEARVPLSRLGTHIGVVVRNTDDPANAGVLSSSFTSRGPGAFVTALPELIATAELRVQPGMRLAITDRSGWRIASAGELADMTPLARPSGWSRFAYGALVEAGEDAALAEPDPGGREQQSYVAEALRGIEAASWFRSGEDGRAIVAVAAPVMSGNDVIGAVILQQGTEAILSLTNQGLARLINVTVFATLIVAAGLLGYATWLSRRIRRLSVAAEQALDRDDLRRTLPSASAGDEIGDLSRSFSNVLRQLGDYNEYLRTLASKLSHELRTPLAIVTSSLENLEHEDLDETSAGYTARARDGADRLRRILSAMSEASRVEELMANAEPEDFDLLTVLQSTTRAYKDAYADRSFELLAPIIAAPMRGAPELLIQMLDKLIDNAVGFSKPGDAIEIGLTGTESFYELTVANPGPPLPEKMRTQLFDSMVSIREGGDDKHLGLGLYVARLIVDGHDGNILADNVENGVRFTVQLPKPEIGD